MVFADSSELSTSIRNAVRHLQQLGESFHTNTLTDADIVNIDSVADTLLALEKEILKLYSDYETESIGASGLRHKLKILPTTIKNEITAAVNAARESNTSVIQELQTELDTLLQKVREYTEQDALLNAAISALQAEKNALQAQHDQTISEVNQRLSNKAMLQITLNETRDTVRETNQHTFDLEEDLMVLKERLMQERNDARQEKARLEEEIESTSKKFDNQGKRKSIIKKVQDVDAANHRVSESEMQLRTMYRERDRFDTDNETLKKKIVEQNELLQMEQNEHDLLLRERLQFTEACGLALLDFQTKKAALEERSTLAHERTNEETEKLKVLKQQHDDLMKETEAHSEATKSLQSTMNETGKELETIKQEIASKLEKTAKLNLDNAEIANELESMREAHQMMIDSLKLQIETLEKELSNIRATRVSKQKEREALLKTIEQSKLTSRDNAIRHNRFVLQTTAKVTDLSERRTILDRNVREDKTQMVQLDEKLSSLKIEYREMKTQFEQHIQQLEESTAQLLLTIDVNRKKISETTPNFEHVNAEHTKMTTLYETAKETMIETKRRKQDLIDRINGIRREMKEKTQSRDLTMLAVKECQHETQERMQNVHQTMNQLEKEIYDKGCRLEILEDENERFQKTIDYLKYQIDLFNRFSQQSTVDIRHLDENNVDLHGTLEIGWQNDRLLEQAAAQKDLSYIDDLTVLLKHTEKRKAKVGTIVHRLIGELQHLKYYLEGMSKPPTPPLLPVATTPDSPPGTQASHRRARQRSLSGDRPQSALSTPPTPLHTTKSRRRPHSAVRGDGPAPSPFPLGDDFQRRVTIFLEDNFEIKSASDVLAPIKKPPKSAGTNNSVTRRSARTDFSSWKSVVTSTSSPLDIHDRRKTATNPRVAFA